MSSIDLYLYYSIDITPLDREATIIKKNINFDKIIKNYPVLKNEEVSKHFGIIKEYCPLSEESFIDTYYADFTLDNHTVKILFYKINNSELLTPGLIFSSETKNILTAIHRTINIENNLLDAHNKYFESELDNIIRVISLPRYYNLSPIYVKDSQGLLINEIINEYKLEEILKINPYDYQRDNINWMIKLENNPIKEYISDNKVFFFPDGRIFNYSLNKFVTNEQRKLIEFKGGIILDDVGIGKTFQLLCLAISNTSINTFILVPDHLETHWKSQFTKHFNIPIPSFITIVKFSDFKNYKLEKYQRFIVDEIHELYSNLNYKNILEGCIKTGCKYKWGISATPFPVPCSIFNIIRFLTEEDIYYTNLERFSYYYNSYYKIFRKNTLENIVKEIKLPNAFEHNILLDFNDQERILYDAETQANANCDEYFLRKCCCDIMINFENKSQIITLTDFNNLVLNDYKEKFLDENKKLEKYIECYANCVETLKKIDEGNDIEVNIKIFKNTDKKELIDNINYYKNKIIEQQEITANRKKAYEYLNSKINNTNKECPVCLSEITEGDKYDVPECGHICCSECMEYWLVSHSSCTICKKSIQKKNIYTITNLNQVKLKYSTKIDKLIEIINNTPNIHEKFIVYTQFDNLIDKLYQTFNIEGFGCVKLQNSDNIDNFRENISNRILILSSVKNASGIDLSFVSNIIIFEPIIGDTLFLRDIEKQIIGRIYRINQTRDINIYRFIINDTIEEQIFNKAMEL